MPRLFPFALFAVFALVTGIGVLRDVTEGEARLLWIVRDVERAEPAAPQDTARTALRNFRSMLDRAETRDLPLAVPLDVWTLLAGDSWPAVVAGIGLTTCLALAVVYRLSRRFSRPVGQVLRVVPVVGVLGLVAYQLGALVWNANYRVATNLASYQHMRQPTEPVITFFREDSPLGYYQAQYDLRRGVAVDLGWREFTDDEIRRVVDSLGDGPIWVLTSEWQWHGRITSIDGIWKITWCPYAPPGFHIMKLERTDVGLMTPCDF